MGTEVDESLLLAHAEAGLQPKRSQSEVYLHQDSVISKTKDAAYQYPAAPISTLCFAQIQGLGAVRLTVLLVASCLSRSHALTKFCQGDLHLYCT